MNRVTSTGMALVLSLAATLLAGCGGSGGGSVPVNGNGGNSGNNASNNPPPPLSPAEFVYAANVLDNTLSQYQIARDGTLTPLAPAPVATASQPAFLVANPKGPFLYVSNLGGTISQYRVNANGTLAPLTPATVPAGTGGSLGGNGASGSGPGVMAVEAAGHFLFVVNQNDQNLREYMINTDGTLTFKGVALAGQKLSFVTAHPQLSVLYVANSDNSTLSQFKIGTDGTLTPLTPATVASPQSPQFLALTPNGKFAYLGFDNNTLPAQYRINADGTLAVINLGTTNASAGSLFPNIDPNSRFVYSIGVGAAGVEIQQFKIGADGTLAPLNPAAIQFGLEEIAFMVFDPSGQFVYIPSPIADAVVGFRINSDGTLTDLPTPAIAAGSFPLSGTSLQRTARRRSVAGGYGALAFIRR